jgi:hypothetical protein
MASCNANFMIINLTKKIHHEKEDAELAAYTAPGIFEIENRIIIDTPEYSYEE